MKRGFLLVTVLLLCVVLLILGLTFLGKRAVQYRRASLAERSLTARGLAEAGMADALLKLQRDLHFPPINVDQSVFSYSEEMTENGRRVGSYTVTIDSTYRNPPFSILILYSEGQVGQDPNRPVAQRRFRAEFDLSAQRRDDDTQPNPYYYQLINFQDLGGP
ncbi:MAG: hypothetical protein KC910_07195 [Candidatus Eremiobacteraeota bacterium]|nr:hypothetical protein [Candidatus Eremiobacteraeota bacterium]